MHQHQESVSTTVIAFLLFQAPVLRWLALSRQIGAARAAALRR
jgi:hypothetical protein